MNQPYPSPIAIRTKTRCKFALPGRTYNCRYLGKYILDGKGYCAPHYDVQWKITHPVYGTQHDWEQRKKVPYLTCRICGAVKVHDGLPQSPCRGVAGRIVLRPAGDFDKELDLSDMQ